MIAFNPTDDMPLSDLNNIQKQAQAIDQDSIFDMLYQQVEHEKKYDTYMEALSTYISENDLDEGEIRNIVGPSLKSILLKEASEMNLVHRDIKVTRTIEDFFE